MAESRLRGWYRLLVTLAVLALCVAIAPRAGNVALAQISPHYALEWHIIGGGGQLVKSAHYVVNSTIGQGAASPPLSVSAHYALSGGYWLPGGYRVYVPVVLRTAP